MLQDRAHLITNGWVELSEVKRLVRRIGHDVRGNGFRDQRIQTGLLAAPRGGRNGLHADQAGERVRVRLIATHAELGCGGDERGRVTYTFAKLTQSVENRKAPIKPVRMEVLE